MIHEVLLPRRIAYGLGAFAGIGEHVAALGRKALIVSDPAMERLGRVDDCRRLLADSGVASAAYCGVHTEPTDRHVAEAMDACRAEGCDVIVAVGGGSCIDAAKAAAVMMTNDGAIGDYTGGRKRFARPPLPLVAVPTTAGTGSEVTKVTVIIDTQTDVKMMISQPELLPAVAIVDAELTLSCPPSVIAASGIDALCHAVEAYISRKAQPVTDGWALQAIERMYVRLPSLYAKSAGPEAYADAALGAMLAGAAFSNASVTLVHGMSRPIGALFHVPHGISNAMLLPTVLDYTAGFATERMAAIGRVVDPSCAGAAPEEQAAAARRALRALCRELNVPSLRGYGIDEAAFRAAVPKMARDAVASGSPANHPRIASVEEIEALYLACYDDET